MIRMNSINRLYEAVIQNVKARSLIDESRTFSRHEVIDMIDHIT